LGVVAAPISSGDTAFRCARLIVADFLKIEQKSLKKRLLICIPLFVVGYFITQMDFAVIWRYFAWANQTLAVITLWTITIYLLSRGKNVFISLIPALVMTYVCVSYFFIGAEMLAMPFTMGYTIAGVVTIVMLILFSKTYLKYKKN
jgi:carbon starvation protein CstA